MSSVAEVAFGLDPGARSRGSGYSCHCPCHDDKNASLDVDEGADGKILMICRAGCSQVSLLRVVRERGLSLDGRHDRRPKNRRPGVSWTPKGIPKTAERLPRVRVVAAYDYQDEHGTLVYQSVRWVPKTFKQRRPDGDGGWIDNMDGVTPLPYRLPEMLAGTTPIYITEGEKDAERLAGYGLIATTNSGGAKKDQIWAVIAKWFKDRRCVVVPDNDDAGRGNVQTVGRALAGVASSLRVLKLPGLPEKGDVSDWLDAGGTIREFLDLAHRAPLWDPAADAGAADEEDPDDKEIARLAALPRIKYGKERKEAAKEIGVPVAILDASVAEKRTAELRKVEPEDNANGQAVKFSEIEVWDEVVDGCELLDALASTIRKYVIITAEQADALALYTVFSHAFAAFEFAPKIIIKSAALRSGKTRLMTVLQRLMFRSLLISGIGANALLRVIEIFCPSLLLDEFDTLVNANKELGEALRGLLNSGFDKAGAQYIKLVPSEDGWEPRAFSTWCPQVVAGIGNVPETVADRSVQIVMVRKLRSERVKRMRERDGGDLDSLARQAARWAADNLEALEDADPAMPEELNDRAADAWSPLFAVAEVAGGAAWLKRAREAAIALSGGEDSESSIPLMLLADVKRVFDRLKEQKEEVTDRVSSDDLVHALTKMHDRPWPEYNRGKGLTQHGLSRLLKPYAITSANVYFGSQAVLKGYHRRQFREVWARYLDIDPDKMPPDPDDAVNDDAVAVPPASAKVYSFGDKVRHNLRRQRSRGDASED